MNLQYQTASGRWIDCETRTPEFLARCQKNNGVTTDGQVVPACSPKSVRLATAEEVLSALITGKTLRNDPADWYSECRAEPAPRVLVPVQTVKCSCGHTVRAGTVMNSSTGTSCPDCYDRMSD